MAFPYITNTEEDRQVMLKAIGVSSSADLFNDIPHEFRNPTLNLPPPVSELELKRELEMLAGKNIDPQGWASFLGAGSYRHYVPSVVGHITGRSEFYTAYTPYQPEISQGTLQTIYEFQSMVSELMGMEVANAGMYDGASALAEAALMACRITGRMSVTVLDTVSPTYIEVLKPYLLPQGVAIDISSSKNLSLKQTTACLIVQQPNFYGFMEDMKAHAAEADAVGALKVVTVDPISLGMLKPPGEYGADVVTAEGQSLGVAQSFGGPYVGLFACKSKHLRQMPGRIVGQTVDSQGRTGYVLTLQTREQHIRRERATSNICTTESLVALATTVYMAALGKRGMQEIATLCYHKAQYAAKQISQLKGFRLTSSSPFFREFTVTCPSAPAEINKYLLSKSIIGGLDVSAKIPNGMLFCVTEVNTRVEIDKLVKELAGFADK
ncbi:MAG: aminomethyl-transferring glycine dehydrogenase subunit GcvPA [Dehalococcoidia bacterium]|nr:aminomethyl-transferring glycine dehydrogenase subunit GcvPA [Dehalococcoidia bacterium]